MSEMVTSLQFVVPSCHTAHSYLKKITLLQKELVIYSSIKRVADKQATGCASKILAIRTRGFT